MSISLKLVPQAQKIAILRANALGDFIFALPAIRAVRAAYPDAERCFAATAASQASLLQQL